MQSQNTLTKLSRRNWLRDTAIAATGVALVPSLLTGCTDHVTPEPGGLGGTPVTEAELRSAARSLHNMIDWLTNLHTLQNDYETDMFLLLETGKAPTGWSDFVINILLDIAVGIITAAAEAASAATAGAGAVAVFAITSELIKKFAWNDDRPDTLKAAYQQFRQGQDDLYKATIDALRILASEDKGNFPNLRARWMDEFDFNGKKYKIRDLAYAQFPSDNQGTDYVNLQNAAYDQFRKYFWRVMFIKAGTMKYTNYWFEIASGVPSQYAVIHYRNYPDTYLRGYTLGQGNFIDYYYRYWYWEFDGRQLSAAAAQVLFKDDYPEHIINPKGLFNRDYVFKQFHAAKPDFFGYYDLRKDFERGPGTGYARYFDEQLDFEFTGGLVNL